MEFKTFYGSKCVFSNFYPSKFVIDEIEYNCVEQFFQFQKAIVFEADDTAMKILGSTSPKYQKQLGRKGIPYFDSKIWNQKCNDVMLVGLMAKFSQNPELKQVLLDSNEAILVEASPTDKYWGIGLSANHPDTRNPEKWPGHNHLGFALMQTRKTLRGDSSP